MKIKFFSYIFLFLIISISICYATWFLPQSPPPQVINKNTNLSVSIITSNGSIINGNLIVYGNVSILGSYINISVIDYNVTGTITGDNIFLSGNLSTDDSILSPDIYVDNINEYTAGKGIMINDNVTIDDDFNVKGDIIGYGKLRLYDNLWVVDADITSQTIHVETIGAEAGETVYFDSDISLSGTENINSALSIYTKNLYADDEVSTPLVSSPNNNLTLHITLGGEDSGDLIFKEVSGGNYDIYAEMGNTALGYTTPFSTLYSTAVYAGTGSGVGYSFYDDTDTRMYSEGANQVDFATNGIKQIEILDLGTGANRLAIYKGENGAYPPTLRLYKSRGTVASPSAITTGDLLGNMIMLGHDGSAYGAGWYNRGLATQTWTTSAHGTQYELYTTKTGATASTENFWIDGSGYIYFPEVYGHDVSAKSPIVLNMGYDGQIGYDSSSEATKENIRPVKDTSWIYDLNVVDFNYIGTTENTTGMIAEQVQSVKPELVTYKVDYDLKCDSVIEYEADNKTIALNQTSCKRVNIRETDIPQTVNYNAPDLISALTKEIQNQKAEIELMKSELCNKDKTYSWC